jgi:hypothetical protein
MKTFRMTTIQQDKQCDDGEFKLMVHKLLRSYGSVADAPAVYSLNSQIVEQREFVRWIRQSLG